MTRLPFRCGRSGASATAVSPPSRTAVPYAGSLGRCKGYCPRAGGTGGPGHERVLRTSASGDALVAGKPRNTVRYVMSWRMKMLSPMLVEPSAKVARSRRRCPTSRRRRSAGRSSAALDGPQCPLACHAAGWGAAASQAAGLRAITLANAMWPNHCASSLRRLASAFNASAVFAPMQPRCASTSAPRSIQVSM